MIIRVFSSGKIVHRKRSDRNASLNSFITIIQNDQLFLVHSRRAVYRPLPEEQASVALLVLMASIVLRVKMVTMDVGYQDDIRSSQALKCISASCGVDVNILVLDGRAPVLHEWRAEWWARRLQPFPDPGAILCACVNNAHEDSNKIKVSFSFIGSYFNDLHENNRTNWTKESLGLVNSKRTFSITWNFFTSTSRSSLESSLGFCTVWQ